MEFEKEINNVSNPCEIFQFGTENRSISFNNNKLKGISTKQNDAIWCRIIKDNKVGVSSGAGAFTFNKLHEAAVSNSKFSKEIKFSFQGSDGKNIQETDLNSKIYNFSDKEMIELGQSCMNLLSKEFPSYNNNVSIDVERAKSHIFSNLGLNSSFSNDSAAMVFQLERTKENDIIEFFYPFFYLPSIRDLENTINEVSYYISLFENIVSIETGNFPVIFHPNASTYLWEPLYAGLNARNVFEKLSPLKNKMGQKILSDKITLFDDPTWKDGINFGYFDDEGVPLSKRTIIEKGVLKSYLTNLDYAARLGIKPTGNGYRKSWLTNDRDIDTAPNILPSNRVMLSGQTEIKDMFSSIDEGVLVLFSADCWLGNLINGDFSGTIDMGFKISNGKPVGRIKNRRVSGNIYNLFNEQLVEVSKERANSYSGYDYVPYFLCKDVAIA